MVGIAQLVRAPDCGSGGRGFEFHYPPHKIRFLNGFFYIFNFIYLINMEDIVGTAYYCSKLFIRLENKIY